MDQNNLEQAEETEALKRRILAEMKQLLASEEAAMEEIAAKTSEWIQLSPNEDSFPFVR